MAEAGRGRYRWRMTPISFKRHRFPPEISQHAVWLYARFTLSFRDVEDLLAERGIATSESGLSRFFRRHAVTHKKTRSTPPSSNDRT